LEQLTLTAAGEDLRCAQADLTQLADYLNGTAEQLSSVERALRGG
jgi:hypothetical protein